MSFVYNSCRSLRQLMSSPKLGVVEQQVLTYCICNTSWNLHVIVIVRQSVKPTATMANAHLTASSIFHECHVAQGLVKHRKLRPGPFVQLIASFACRHLYTTRLSETLVGDLRGLYYCLECLGGQVNVAAGNGYHDRLLLTVGGLTCLNCLRGERFASQFDRMSVIN